MPFVPKRYITILGKLVFWENLGLTGLVICLHFIRKAEYLRLIISKIHLFFHTRWQNDFNSSIAMNDRPVRPGIAAADRYLGSIRIRYQKMAAAWYHLNVAAVHYFIFFQ